MTLLDQVVDQLANIELKDQDIAEYITGILTDNSMEDDEKHEVMTEFLSEATDKDTEALITTLLTNSKTIQEDQLKEAEQKRSKLIEEARLREEERRIQAEKEQEENASLRTAQKQLTKEQKQAREHLMRQYGYVSEGEEEKETEEPKQRRGKPTTSAGKEKKTYNGCSSLSLTLFARSTA
ncbi:hypothetical protein BD560DRAFT_393445 [Blakeslea trispora]|nr:hypothetical protein BD560DRAFT_393445 [Blakeslea trispora]